MRVTIKPILLEIPNKIETKNLRLQMPEAGWGIKLHEAILDGYDDYIEWLTWPAKQPSVEDVEVDCRKHHADFITREFIRYLIIEKSSGDVVGRCAFPSFQANWEVPQFGVSYFIRKSARRKGYATEASKAMTGLAFAKLGAKKVEIYCDEDNVASCKIPEKLGFELEYSQRGGWPKKDGSLTKLRTYAMFSVENLK